jgi:hypothetical protein
VRDQQTITALRDANDIAVRDHHLETGAAASAWSAAHAPRRRMERALAIAAGVVGAVGLATALAVSGNNGKHANPPVSGSTCAANTTTAPLPTWAQAGFSPAGLHTPHVLSEHGNIIAVLFVQPRVHQPAGTHNKILWVARAGYGPLHIRAHLEGTSQTVTRELPNGPGPSYVDMPAAGCWQMRLTWSKYDDTINLQYQP